MSTELKTKTELAVYNFAGEIISDPIHADISIDVLQHMVENFPRNSVGMLFNRMFESENFIFIHNGSWYFFDAYTKNKAQMIEPWDWNTSVAKFEEHCDREELVDFHEGWSYVDEGELAEDLEDDVFSILGKRDSDFIQMSLPSLSNSTSEIFFKKRIKTIINDFDLSDDEKSDAIFNLMQLYKD